ncbi:MAG: hypothetical protein KJT01_16610 [Gemmatimonadetes bacterium]|nr:hypothetical protein [Gemmatimonadota bacterium]
MRRALRLPAALLTVTVPAVLATALPTALRAQAANPSVAAFGMAGNYTAAARGFEATVWNAALLGLPGAPRFSLGALVLGSSAGIGPITVRDLADYSGATIPADVRRGWVNAVRSAGSQQGTVDASLTLLAFSAGRFGAQLSSTGGARMGLGADAMELFFLGNAEAVAANRTLRPNGSLTANAFLTPSVSYAVPLRTSTDGGLALAVTAKYVQGLADVDARDNGSAIAPDTVRLRFPVVRNTPESGTDGGGGVGTDLSLAWRRGSTTAGVVVTNAFNNFAWDASAYRCQDIRADLTVNTNSTGTNEVPCAGALSERVRQASARRFRPGVRAGVAFAPLAALTLTGDLAAQPGRDDETLRIGPKTSAGVGAEYRGIPFLPLRAGFSVITGGTITSAGASLRLGSFEIGAALQQRSVDGISSANLMLGLVTVR